MHGKSALHAAHFIIICCVNEFEKNVKEMVFIFFIRAIDIHFANVISITRNIMVVFLHIEIDIGFHAKFISQKFNE